MELLERTMNVVPAESKEGFFEELYEKAFPAFAGFASRMHASFDDARDIFHDALVIYCEKCQQPDFIIRDCPEAYVVGIAKHLWNRRFHQGRRNVPFDDMVPEAALPADYYPTVNEMRLLKFVERAGKRCMDLLRKFYFERTSLREIAESLGYRSEHSAAVQKYKCIAKMRDAIKEKAMGYEDFVV